MNEQIEEVRSQKSRDFSTIIYKVKCHNTVDLSYYYCFLYPFMDGISLTNYFIITKIR